MKAIVVTDQAAGAARAKLVERPNPQAAINVMSLFQIHASAFTGDELTWPSRPGTDRDGRSRTPSIPGHELAGVVTRSRLQWRRRGCRLDSGSLASAGLVSATARWRSNVAGTRHATSHRCRAMSTSPWKARPS